MPTRFLELFAGIGGFSAAQSLTQYNPQKRYPQKRTTVCGQLFVTEAAVDIDQCALATYSLNFSHRVHAAEISSFDLRPYADCGWWMSPPCLPYTRRGNQLGLSDPRAESFKYVVNQIAQYTPPIVALENVPPFADSNAFQFWTSTLTSVGYEMHGRMACPTELGIPMRRKRFYALAIHREMQSSSLASVLLERFHRSWPTPNCVPLANYLIDSVAISSVVFQPSHFDQRHANPSHTASENFDVESVMLNADIQSRYRGSLDVVDSSNPQSVCACFTSSYGKSIIRSGSYLQLNDRLRRFFPREIARLLGFHDSFILPASHRTAYRLLGNSLSVDVVRTLFSS